jgi:hypothetical protein
VVYDPAHHEMGRWTWSPNTNVSNVAAISDEDSVYLNEYEFRSDGYSQVLMRLELGTGARSMLFPKRAMRPSR